MDGKDILKANFVNVIEGRTKEKREEFKKAGEYKLWLYSGDFRIVKQDGTREEIYLPHHDFGFCLLIVIKKLQFITRKYEGV